MANPRKPSALKVLQGNPGKRALPKNEPQFPAGAQPPAWLTGEVALAEWRRVAALLESQRVLTEGDATALAVYCALVEEFVAGVALGKADKLIAGEIRQYLSKFGLTPADRSRVSASDAKPESKLSKFVVVGGRSGR